MVGASIEGASIEATVIVSSLGSCLNMVPGLHVSCHSVEDGYQLPHAGRLSNFEWFAGFKQAIVEGPDDWIVPRSGERGHV